MPESKTLKAAIKELNEGDRKLTGIRKSLAEATAELATLEPVLDQLKADRKARILAVAMTGHRPEPVPAESERIHATEQAVSDLEATIQSLALAERALSRSVYQAERAAKTELAELWGIEESKARADLIETIAPKLSAYWHCRQNAGFPISLDRTLDIRDLRLEIEAAAESLPPPAIDIRPDIASSVLTLDERAAFRFNREAPAHE